MTLAHYTNSKKPSLGCDTQYCNILLSHSFPAILFVFGGGGVATAWHMPMTLI